MHQVSRATSRELQLLHTIPKYSLLSHTDTSGSPYWCMKAFACLAAPDEHPFWTSTELAWPADLFPPIKALPDPSQLLIRSGSHTFLLSSGQSAHYALRHAAAKYGKFAYSSAFGFSCPTGDLGLEQVAGDSMLALRDVGPGTEGADGESWRVRRVPLDARIVGRGTEHVYLRSGWKPWGDVHVETWLVPPQPDSPCWYIRVHKVTTGRRLESAEAGWAMYGQGPDGRAIVQVFSGEKSVGGEEEEGWTRVVNEKGCVGVVDLPISAGAQATGAKAEATGSDGKRMGKLVQSDPNSNVIFSRSVLPTLVGHVEVGTSWVAVAVFGLPAKGMAEGGWEREWERKPTVPGYVFE
jgi:hypothetical protein